MSPPPPSPNPQGHFGAGAGASVAGAEAELEAAAAARVRADDLLAAKEAVLSALLAAAGDVRYHERSRLPLFDALAAVRHGGTVDEIRDRLLSNGERHLHSRRRIAERFAALPTGRGTADSAGRRFLWPAAVEQTVEIAGRCTFSLDELKYEYPDAIVPAGRTFAATNARTVSMSIRSTSAVMRARPWQSNARAMSGASATTTCPTAWNGLRFGGRCTRRGIPIAT